MVFYLTAGAILLISAGLLKPHFGKKKQAKCLKCEVGMGQELHRKQGKISFKCDSCGSIWVERL